MKDVGGEFNSNMSHILKHYVPGTVLVNWDPKSFKKMRDSFVCLFVRSFIICSFDSYLLSAYYVPGTVLDTEASSDQRKSPCMQLVKKTHENKSEEISPKKLVRMRTDKRPFDPTSMRDHREQFWWTDGYKT